MHFQAKYAVDTLITFFVFPILHFVMRLTAIGRKKMHKLLCRRWISKLAAKPIPSGKAYFRKVETLPVCKTKKNKTGNVLLSQAASHQVSSALRSLTTVFEMGTGVSSPL